MSRITILVVIIILHLLPILSNACITYYVSGFPGTTYNSCEAGTMTSSLCVPSDPPPLPAHSI